MEWLTTAEQVLSLLVAFVGLIGTVISTFVAVKATIEKNKGKSLAEIWSLIMYIADEAMKTAENSGKSGADKKQMVMDTIHASAKAANLDISLFTKQINDYIDQTIKFVNGMRK
jgi:Na+-transporting methylmalonyl-CoA/oxaloacetate decarboxylase gamma subunit